MLRHGSASDPETGRGCLSILTSAKCVHHSGAACGRSRDDRSRSSVKGVRVPGRERTCGPLVLRPLSGKQIDRRDVYRMWRGSRKLPAYTAHQPALAGHAAITNALDAGVPLRYAQILARHAHPRTSEHQDRARGNLDRHGVHFLTAYVAGI